MMDNASKTPDPLEFAKKLNKKCFEQRPVWTWTDDEQGFIPVEVHSSLPLDRGTLLIAAKLYPAKGPVLHGYVISQGTVYAVGIFADNSEYVFNRRMGSLTKEVSAQLFTALQTAPFELFPLEFRTEFGFAEQGNVEGIFTVKS
jgi:hypothetical protein